MDMKPMIVITEKHVDEFMCRMHELERKTNPDLARWPEDYDEEMAEIARALGRTTLEAGLETMGSLIHAATLEAVAAAVEDVDPAIATYIRLLKPKEGV